MHVSRSELESIIDRFRGAPILVYGDVLVDHYIWGTVDRVSPEAPVVVVSVKREDRRLGGAGNVARNIAALGGRPVLAAVVGADEAGRQLGSLLNEIGVDSSGLVVDESRPTIVKSRVIAHSQQVVRIDYEKIQPLPDSVIGTLRDAVARLGAGVAGVTVSDYGKGTVGSTVLQGLLNQSTRIPVLVDPKAPHFALYRGATVVKPNRSEAAEASGMAVTDRASAIIAARRLLTDWCCAMVLITLGEEGMVLVTASDSAVPAVEVDTVAQEVFDVSGAGDTVSAVFTLALAVGASPASAAVLANCAAGIVVGEVGTVAVSADALREQLDTFYRTSAEC